MTLEAMGTAEDYLLLAGVTADGRPLHDEDAEKLLRLPAQVQKSDPLTRPPDSLNDEILRLEAQHTAAVNSRNLGYFDAEVQKLDAWADDLKNGLENEVKEIDREIRDVRRSASVAATLEDKLQLQKRQRELEGKRNQLRRRIFDRQDEIDGQRNKLIAGLEARLSSSSRIMNIFVIQWRID